MTNVQTVGRFLKLANESLSLTAFSMLPPDRKAMIRIAEPDSYYTKIHQEVYEGDWSPEDVISFIEAARVSRAPCYVSITNYGENLAVCWEETVPYTEEERQNAVLWLVANPEQELKPVKWRKPNGE